MALIDAMPQSIGVVRDSVELQTSTKPYSITIHYTVKEEKDMGNEFFFRNAIILLSLVENVDIIYGEFYYAGNNSSTTAKYPCTREMAEKWMGEDVRSYASNINTLNTLIDRSKNIWE